MSVRIAYQFLIVRMYCLLSCTLVFLGGSVNMEAQDCTPHVSCPSAVLVEGDLTFQYDFEHDYGCDIVHITENQSYAFRFGSFYAVEICELSACKELEITSPDDGSNKSLTVYGPLSSFNCDEYYSQDILTTYSFQSDEVESVIIDLCEPGWYLFRFQHTGLFDGTIGLEEQFDFESGIEFGPCDSLDACETCIGSFAPVPGEDYTVSAWVKEDGAPQDVLDYEDVELKVLFPGVGGTVAMEPKGQIIDGWQRIYETVLVPTDATIVRLELISNSGAHYFDDIRFEPNDASMKTYVYDPITMRMVAEQDERNYSTFYEYDEEGKLIRIKRETERGIKTLKSIQSNTQHPTLPAE